MTKKSFIKGTVILTVSGLVVRLTGFIYRIYLSNLIGSEGMGLFQLIAPVYSLVILTLTAGISIAVSKLVAQEHAKGNIANAKRVTLCALFLVTSAGILVALLMYFNLNSIVNILIKDQRTYYAMVFLLPCIPVIAAASALKGYFYGVQDMTPTAVSQIVEQLVRISIVLCLAGYYMRVSIEYACAIATAGMAIGEISNLFVLSLIYNYKNRKVQNKKKRPPTISKRKALYALLRISIPVSSNRFVSSIMSTIEYILIPRMLLMGGMDYQSSIELYGKLAGMAMPLIFFPAIITSSLATTLVPSISEAVSLKHFKTANYRISRAIQFSAALGFMFAGLFMTYSQNISDIVYKNQDIGTLLYLLSFTCIFIYLHQTLLGILNGLDRQAATLRNSLIGNILRIGVVIFLVPRFGIVSYILALASSIAFVSLLDLIDVSKTSGLAVNIRNWFLKPGLCCIMVVLTGKYILNFYSIFKVHYVLQVLMSIGTSIVFAVTVLGIMGVLDVGRFIIKFTSKNIKTEEISRIF